LRPSPRTSFHHQPEAQHPKIFSYPQAGPADYPIFSYRCQGHSRPRTSLIRQKRLPSASRSKSIAQAIATTWKGSTGPRRRCGISGGRISAQSLTLLVWFAESTKRIGGRGLGLRLGTARGVNCQDQVTQKRRRLSTDRPIKLFRKILGVSVHRLGECGTRFGISRSWHALRQARHTCR
jgi:hypothetical protein